jgi:acetyl esterase
MADVLHPRARAAVESVAGETAVFAPGHDVEDSRRRAREEALAEPRVPVEEVRDLDAEGVPVRLYRPAGARPGVLVHVHGGGFVFHDVDVHDNAARRLALACGLPVLSVDYRRPPEHRFPAAPDDVDTVLTWLDGSAAELGVAGPRYIHGDSAGGNLALVAALRRPDLFAAVVLTYPFLDPQAAGASYALPDVGFDPREAAWYWQQYAASADDLTDPDLAPLLSDRLGTLPPTLVVTAEGDPLRDEGELLVRRLAELDVPVVGTRYLGQVHGFWRHTDVFVAADALTGQIAGFLAAHPDGHPL